MQSNAPTERYFLRKRKAALTESNSPQQRDSYRKRKIALSQSKAGTSIKDLPDELLGQIIRGLKPKDRIFSELVSRRWNRVSRAYGWLGFRLIAEEQLSYMWEHPNWQERQNELEQAKVIVEKQIKCLLCRCAPTVREIDLTGIDQYGFDGRVCELLPNGMRRLETLNLEDIQYIESSQLTLIGDRLPWLKSISLGACFRGAESEGLAFLLTSCRCLESLNLNHYLFPTTKQPLSSLPTTLRRLEISSCLKIQPSLVESLQATCAENLRELQMCGVRLDGWTNRDLERFFAVLVSLESLNFGEHLRHGRDEEALGDVATRLLCLGGLKNLHRLELQCNESVTSEVLGRIVDGCQELESLKLLDCHNADISKAAVCRVAQLPKLTHLWIWWHRSIDDDTLTELAKGPAKLRELNISSCKQVTDKGISHLLEGCGETLRDLYVYNCPLVTRITVEKLEAVYSSKNETKQGIFVLWADKKNFGFDRKEFGAN